MLNKEYRLVQMKRQLNNLKRKGIESVEWKLSYEQLDFITNVLKFKTEVFLYEIKTRTFSQTTLRNENAIIKDIHYSKIRGKERIVRKLKKTDRKLLSEYGVKFTPFKYIIYLS